MAHKRIACGCFVFLWGIMVVLRGMPEDSIYVNVVKLLLVNVVSCVVNERLSGSSVWKRKLVNNLIK